jgi:hypothetical protein
MSHQHLLHIDRHRSSDKDHRLITAEAPVSDWSGTSPPGGSRLFLPTQTEASEAHTIEPSKFLLEAVARIDSCEFEKLRSVHRRTWVSERKVMCFTSGACILISPDIDFVSHASLHRTEATLGLVSLEQQMQASLMCHSTINS